MIGYIEGKILQRDTSSLVVLTAGGVGYSVCVCASEREQLVLETSVSLYIYEHIREGMYDLYGFSTTPSKSLFEQLLSVNGVGPKMAMSLLDLGEPAFVASQVREGDVRFLTTASGVGKRLAERIIVDLRDKIAVYDDSGNELKNNGSVVGVSRVGQDEALEALLSLGYTKQDGIEMLRDVHPDMTLAEKVTHALKAKRG
jgi:holliday junction DNA helicase RuvA